METFLRCKSTVRSDALANCVHAKDLLYRYLLRYGTDQRLLINVLAGVDHLAFFDRDIILDLRHRSQGSSVKSTISNTSPDSHQNVVYPFSIQNGLEDVALIASGSSSADVRDTEERTVVLRITRNVEGYRLKRRYDRWHHTTSSMQSICLHPDGCLNDSCHLEYSNADT